MSTEGEGNRQTEPLPPGTTATWHCQTQEIRLVDGDETTQKTVAEAWERDDFTAEPVTTRVENTGNSGVSVSSQWDGRTLSIDVDTTEPALSSRAAARAWVRHLRTTGRHRPLVVAVLTVLLLLVGLALI